jgi:para-nitrobenzyl esterase
MRHFAFVALCTLLLCCSNTVSEDALDTTQADMMPRAPDTMLVAPTLEIDMSGGTVIGRLENDLRVFKGIPYAAPPTGEGRFRPPAAHSGWTMPLNADSYGPGCPQSGTGGGLAGANVFSEDCLTLNVWAPNTAGPKPVMFWIHGGAFILGSSGTSLYDGTALSKRGDVIVVTINYRLGQLGFLPLDAFRPENEVNGTGNYGLLDQQFALKWVQENIVRFGGDPDNITLFGESAGAFSVCNQIGMPGSDGLYHRAIIQSGGGCWSLFPGDSIRQDADIFLQASSCADSADIPACLRALSVEEILRAQNSGPGNFIGAAYVGPYVDGGFITEEPIERVARQAAPRVPIITGSTALEVALFSLLGFLPHATEADLDALIDSFVATEAQREFLKTIYPLDAYPFVKAAVDEMGTDGLFSCPQLLFMRTAQAAGYDVRGYEFRHNMGGLLTGFGPMHASDVPIVFGNEVRFGNIESEIDPAAVEQVQGLWTHFAREGSFAESDGWPPFKDDSPSILALDTELSLIERFRDGRCEALFENGLIPQQGFDLNLSP